MRKKLLGWVKSKTVWGAVAIAASFVLPDHADVLKAIGTTIGGAGVADKLDRIKEELKK